MPVLDILPFVHGIFYVVLQSVLLAGLLLESLREQRVLARGAAREGQGAGPRVSVVIPLHNEESRLAPLLESLALQDYPQAEFILINDRSTDGTGALISRFARGRSSVRVISLQENPGPNHKQYALQKGLEAAKGELFLFTDADCRLSPGWIRAMTELMGDPRTGAVIAPVFRQGYTSGSPDREAPDSAPLPRRGFLRNYQIYDHVVRFVYLGGAVGLGAAGGGFGNNLILRRAALDEAGGYGAVPPSPTEDAALISLIRSSTSYQVRSACGRESHVFTGFEPSWKALINQTLRWNNGGLFSPEILTRINYTVLMITIAAAVFAFLLLPLFPNLWPMPLAQLIVMLENTAGALFIARGGIGKTGKAGSSLPPVFWIRELLFMPFYMTLMTILGFLGVKTTWKNSTLGSRV
ncbi:MAG: glycosyltransferase [Treponema sp.]|jgi:cellulose synthase/poly-beta-1,6-N-acetylglucosamine synthase-like glycosyltransferase|nr:glycosyltransferase [Treponema sp.]